MLGFWSIRVGNGKLAYREVGLDRKDGLLVREKEGLFDWRCGREAWIMQLDGSWPVFWW